MKYYIPHRILVINEQIVAAKQEEVLHRCYQLAFDWANRMGLEGKKVFDLFLEKRDYGKDPVNINQSYLWCKIECTEAERARWEEMQKLNNLKYIYDILYDKESDD